ncbi:MAG: hypothetical protein LBR32_02235 [Propionibacteriaceae bacterium]|jgi:mannitol-1-phosphate 5-dehydrogenase|nr:hypothetical protein [Propionibacteriaceae bacterium]
MAACEPAGRTIAVIGAGMVGRGLLAELFGEAGWLVRLIDVDEALVEALRRDGGFRHIVADGLERRESWVPVADAVTPSDKDAARVVAGSELVATAVGARNLPGLAPLLAQAGGLRGRGLDVILCENLAAADSVLLRELTYLGARASDFGLARSVVGRMIPPSQDQLAVVVEPYGELLIDHRALCLPHDLPPRVVVDDAVSFDFYEERKLAVHNLGHFLAAMLGLAYGDEYVHQAVARPQVWAWTRAAMMESAAALAVKHHVPLEPLEAHADDLMRRFANTGLNDPNARVARDPQRKLADGERVALAMEMTRDANLSAPHLRLAQALAEDLADGRRLSPQAAQSYLIGIR